MLNNKLKYVCLDFETTGLDTEKDEAIQIGILSFDYTGKITDSFVSYIKPEKPINELKDIVRVVTGLDMQQLVSAPSFSEIQERVLEFFDESTIIIGHNVQFDTAFLKRYTNAKYLTEVDTFPLAQSLMPFSQSYALEVLEKSLPLSKDENVLGLSSSHHDALYDAHATYKVFLECIRRIEKIRTSYPEIDTYLDRSNSPIKQCLNITPSGLRLSASIPLLSKAKQGEKKLISPTSIAKTELTNKAHHYMGDTPLKNLFKKLPHENVIYAFSQRNKSMIAKNILHEIGLTQVDMGNSYAFDMDLMALFLRKPQFDQGETYFFLKYFFHACSAHSTIDLNSSYDRKIYHAIKDRSVKNTTKSAEILTHDQLYEKLLNQEIMPYTTIYFFDQDRWYDTHMKREQKPFDIHYLLQVTDSCIYKDTLLKPENISARTAIHTKLVIFLGIRQTEVAGLLKDVSNTTVEINNIIDNTYFYKTTLLVRQIQEELDALETKVSPDDYAFVQEKRGRFVSIISGICAINTKLQGEEIHFQVKKLHSFMDYSDFEELFEMYQTLFFSVTKKDRPKLGGEDEEKVIGPAILEWPGKDRISYEGKNIFVFSNNKQTSQELLVWLHAHKPEKHKVHGENITGGKGKNIFAIKASEYNLIIGGYDFFLQCIAQKVSIDKVYTLCINGPLQYLISSDLAYYGSIPLS